jgi:hypothetical protein
METFEPLPLARANGLQNKRETRVAHNTISGYIFIQLNLSHPLMEVSHPIV